MLHVLLTAFALSTTGPDLPNIYPMAVVDIAGHRKILAQRIVGGTETDRFCLLDTDLKREEDLPFGNNIISTLPKIVATDHLGKFGVYDLAHQKFAWTFTLPGQSNVTPATADEVGERIYFLSTTTTNFRTGASHSFLEVAHAKTPTAFTKLFDDDQIRGLYWSKGHLLIWRDMAPPGGKENETVARCDANGRDISPRVNGTVADMYANGDALLQRGVSDHFKLILLKSDGTILQMDAPMLDYTDAVTLCPAEPGSAYGTQPKDGIVYLYKFNLVRRTHELVAKIPARGDPADTGVDMVCSADGKTLVIKFGKLFRVMTRPAGR